MGTPLLRALAVSMAAVFRGPGAISLAASVVMVGYNKARPRSASRGGQRNSPLEN